MSSHPAAHRAPVYEQLAADLQRQGVDTVFGLMSDDTALFVTALDGLGVRFVAARHENTACVMADGYAAASGRLGVAILGRGPATANALHGAVTANRSGNRVLLVFGYASTVRPPPNGLGPDGKALDAPAVLQAAGIRCFVASDAAGARRTLARAVEATWPHACAALLLPTDVQFSPCDEAGQTAPLADATTVLSTALSTAPLRPRPAALAAAAALLAQSRAPLIIAGLGAHRAGARDALQALADQTGAVLATTLKAKDMFHGHPFNGGLIGSFSHAAGRRLFDQADCVIAFGAGLNQRTTSYGTALPAAAPLIQVDAVRANIGRWCHADVALVADAREAAQQLAAALPVRAAADKPLHSDAHRQLLAGHDLAREFTPAHTPRTLDPRTLALTLDGLLPADRNTVYDTGNFLQVLPYLSGLSPSHTKTSHDFSSIGMGFGTALGFACGAPQRPTVFVTGDGSLLMNLGELETTAREDIPLVIVLLNDCAYGAELHYLKMRDAPVARSQFVDIDFAPIAQALGFQAATVRTLDELAALAPLLREPQGPILLDCKINGAVMAPFLLETVEHERRRR